MRREYQLRNAMGWLLWLLFAVAFFGVCGHRVMAGHNSVVPIYRAASLHWLSGQPLYQLNTIHGFLYLPSSAVLTAPLSLLPAPAHELFWRVLCLGLLAFATWRLARAIEPSIGRDTFLLLSLLVVPVSIGSLRAGQMNIPLAATMALATAACCRGRFSAAAGWLALGIALKPQAAVLLLLLAGLHPAIRRRAPLALASVFLLPFLTQLPHYAAHQYLDCWTKMGLSANPLEAAARFNDLFGLLGGFGLEVSESGQWFLRCAAAFLTLLLVRSAWRRNPALHPAVIALAGAACYLMLFNPRTEGGSYIVAALPLAAYVAWEIDGRRRHALGLAGALVALGWSASYDFSFQLWRLWHALGLPTDTPDYGSGAGPFWLSPLLALCFAAYLVRHGITALPEPLAPSSLEPAPAVAE